MAENKDKKEEEKKVKKFKVRRELLADLEENQIYSAFGKMVRSDKIQSPIYGLIQYKLLILSSYQFYHNYL